ncbi:sulfatase-like hydrolase/transferase [Chondromyces apiculatus]|nr:sulfatase-like hydrolase/transferase [Chondromyces apiculatus]
MYLWEAAGTLAMGVTLAVPLALGAYLVARGSPAETARRRRWFAALLCYAAGAAVLMGVVLSDDLHRQARIPWGSRLEAPLFVLYALLCGLAVPLAHVVGTRAWPRWLSVVLGVLGLVALGANHGFLRDDYPGVHGALAWVSGTLTGAAVAPCCARVVARWRPRTRALLGAASLLPFALVLGAQPSNAVRLSLLRDPCSLAAWTLARVRWSSPGPQPAPGAEPPLPPDLSASFWRDRASLPPTPSRSSLAPGIAPVVVLITVDAMRADVLSDAAHPAHERALPVLTTLAREGAYFPRVIAPGSQTAVSLATMFSGRYFSQMVWGMYGRGNARFVYPAKDPARRFPELLTEHGVRTASVCSLNFLAGAYGVARGFQDEQVVARGRHHAHAQAVVDPLLEILEGAGAGPLFVYAHLTEPHAPYDRGARTGGAFERYLSEVGVADAQLGRVVAVLEERFRDRGYLFVTSDHGEAFGEHGTREHSKTLYEELVQVPLLARGPGIVPRRIEERVGLIDLGPTILDLFGVETPASFFGQSLVPRLAGRAGEEAPLDRPLLAEGRLRRALYWGDLKVIDDPRRKVVEAYDLAADPLETRNLFDAERPRVLPALLALRAFFKAHRPARPGYEPPYRP